MSLASGTRLGPYEILAPIGAGGMGEVYRAKTPREGHLKILDFGLAKMAAESPRNDTKKAATSAGNSQ